MKTESKSADRTAVAHVDSKQAGGDFSQKSIFLGELKNRLFDTSRRNRLLYFRPAARYANLTIAGFQLNEPQNQPTKQPIFPEDILSLLSKGKTEISIDERVGFEQHGYMHALLDKLRLEDAKNHQETGEGSLKLVLGFLQWQDKNKATTNQSPLAFLPVKIIKTKEPTGVSYQISWGDSSPEFNPVLLYYLNREFRSGQISPSEKEDGLDAWVEKWAKATAGIGIDLVKWPAPSTQQFQQLAQSALLRYRNNDGLTADLDNHPGNMGPELNDTVWAIDFSQVVLGNFRYRGKEIVNDYETLSSQGTSLGAIQVILEQRKPDEKESPTKEGHLFKQDLNMVLPFDPAQAMAIGAVAAGRNIVVQGPPGTGKSQTIVNLMADSLSKGKKILFVCSKKAALDVVYQRLVSVGLDWSVAYLHDAVSEKKQFIQSVKESLDEVLSPSQDLEILLARQELLKTEAARNLQSLEAFHRSNHSIPRGATLSLIDLIEALIANGSSVPPELTPEQWDTLPTQKVWKEDSSAISAFESALKGSGLAEPFRHHSLSIAGEFLLANLAENTKAAENIQSILERLSRMVEKLNELGVPPRFLDTFSSLRKLIVTSVQLNDLEHDEDISLLLKGKNAIKEWQARNSSLPMPKADTSAIEKKQAETWQKVPDRSTVSEMLSIYRDLNNKWYRSLLPKWRRLRSALKEHGFSEARETDIAKALEETIEFHDMAACQELDKSSPPTQSERAIRIMDILVLVKKTGGETSLAWFKQYKGNLRALLGNLASICMEFESIELSCKRTVHESDSKTISEIREAMQTLTDTFKTTRDVKPIAESFLQIGYQSRNAIRSIPLSIKEIGTAVIWKTIYKAQREHPVWAGMTEADLATTSQLVMEAIDKLSRLVPLIEKAKAAEQLRPSTARIGRPDPLKKRSKLSNVDQIKKGSKIWEREFEKKRSHKSVRTLATGESGVWLNEMKRIWMMSPAAVSIVLPMKDGLFDIVVFDEASQLPLEDCIPSLARAKQVVVVGDVQQLPPTSFFNQRTDGAQKIPRNRYEKILEAPSILEAATQAMPSCLLDWHYRSRCESLIRFSNQHFYGNRLKMVPDRKLDRSESEAYHVIGNDEPNEKAIESFGKEGISYHYLSNGAYHQRCNMTEAIYIAKCFWQLWTSGKRSIGIIAFGIEQQTAIEKAMRILNIPEEIFEIDATGTDDSSRPFIKNLESVQGDERDIILISIGYGPDKGGKTALYFGPINKEGGAKRLNVLMSRAKQHLAIITSLLPENIPITENPGVGMFRKLLEMSKEHARSPNRFSEIPTEQTPITFQKASTAMLLKKLKANGIGYRWEWGSTGKKIDIAVLDGREGYFKTCHLLDPGPNGMSVFEDYCFYPNLLAQNGWAAEWKLAKRNIDLAIPINIV